MRIVALVLALAACHRAPPLRPPIEPAMVVVDRDSAAILKPWAHEPLAPNEALAPADSSTSAVALAAVLAPLPHPALSLVGVSWAGRAAELSALGPLEWADFTGVRFERGALAKVTAKHLVLSHSNVTDEELSHLSTQTIGLQLEGTRVTAASLDLFAHLQLETLGLAHTQIDGGSFSDWRAPSTLRSLTLSGLLVNDDAVAFLERLPALEKLVLDETQLTDAGMVHLRELAHLVELDLSDTQVGDAGLRGLELATGLRSLRLANTRIGNVTVKRLGALTHLEVLDLSGTSLDDAGVKALAPLTALTQLALSHTAVTAEALLSLKTPELRRLDLEKTRVDEDLARVVAKLPKLQALDVSHTRQEALDPRVLPMTLTELRAADSGLDVTALKGRTRFEVLDLSSLDLTDELLTTLVHDSPNLRLLKANFTMVGDGAAPELARHPRLARLDLGKTSVTDAGLKSLSASTSLRQLDVGLCTVGDVGVRALSALPLISLNLAATKVTDAGLVTLPRTLQRLGLYGVQLHSAAPLRALPALRELDLRQTGLTDTSGFESVDVVK